MLMNVIIDHDKSEKKNTKVDKFLMELSDKLIDLFLLIDSHKHSSDNF